MKAARDEFAAVKKKRYDSNISRFMRQMLMLHRSSDLFNKAYNHIADRIDQVYKDLTKGKAAPMGGVAYLSLEDTEVREMHQTNN